VIDRAWMQSTGRHVQGADSPVLDRRFQEMRGPRHTHALGVRGLCKRGADRGGANRRHAPQLIVFCAMFERSLSTFADVYAFTAKYQVPVERFSIDAEVIAELATVSDCESAPAD